MGEIGGKGGNRGKGEMDRRLPSRKGGARSYLFGIPEGTKTNMGVQQKILHEQL